jgi:hypothetical protein
MLLWLVCQQLAMAAYACSGPPGGPPMAPAAAMPPMAGRAAAVMPMSGMGPDCVDLREGAPAHALCESHCHPDHVAQPDVRAPSVPPAMLGMLAPRLVMPAMAEASSGNLRVRAKRWRPPAPPPMLLYCSLLI